MLVVREKKLVDEQTKLASVLKIYNKQKDDLSQTIALLDEIKTESESYLLEGDTNPTVISNYSSYIRKVQNDIKLQNEIIAKTREVLNNQQNIVKEAYIKVKSLENLREKQKEQYLKELQLEEIKEIDDIVNSRRNIA